MDKSFFDSAETDKAEIDFLVARGRAIQAYSVIEQSLVALFANLMGVETAIAGIPFFRINNARARNGILERLLKKRHGPKYNIFFSSLDKQIRILDAHRNAIVHWSEAEVLGSTNPNHVLVPPNYWDHDENMKPFTLEAIHEFTKESEFIARLVHVFTRSLAGKIPAGDSLQQIFLRPIDDPLPSDHLYYTRPKEFELPLLSSEGKLF